MQDLKNIEKEKIKRRKRKFQGEPELDDKKNKKLNNYFQYGKK